MSNKPFQKFIQQKESGAKKKERIRQEKKKIRQETKAYFDKKKAEKAATRAQPGAVGRPSRTNQAVEPAPGRKPAGPVLKKQGGTTKPVSTDSSKATAQKEEAQMPLNKFIAHSGICSRRDAADLVRSGKVTVNNQRVVEPGFKVSRKDEVKVNGKKIIAQRNLVYILLNKPKDFITTTEDPQGRKTVLDIVKNATTERVYPIGRLDRNTTGVLLLTNDGELAQKLSHPSYEIKKIYEVTLDRQVSKKDFDTIANGGYSRRWLYQA